VLEGLRQRLRAKSRDTLRRFRQGVVSGFQGPPGSGTMKVIAVVERPPIVLQIFDSAAARSVRGRGPSLVRRRAGKEVATILRCVLSRDHLFS
jgi:hypothetical protein